ncbi:MAG: class I SAM-dependent methyltransferase [Acidobacteriia bacterium]|nr:class I SAM-dependent methyltransferase [Terriglobia bacterium]
MPPTNLREVVRGFHTRVIRDSVRPLHSTSDKLLPGLETLGTLRLAYEELCRLRGGVGRLPPRPNTLRARIGARLVSVVQRMLFWYTPQILRFHSAATLAMEATCMTFEKQMEVLQQLVGEIDELRLELRVRTGSPGPPPAGAECRPVRDPPLDAFEFEFRSKLRGSAGIFQANLQSHLETILSIAPGPPEGPWVDLGCGAGEWCRLVGDTGREICGVEPNTRAAGDCRRAGIDVEQRDCLEFLRCAPDYSIAVISSFHELERHGFPYVFESIRQAARILKPGGFLIIEATNPANVLASSERFWQDPANSRLLPDATIEALLCHFGFRVVSRRELNNSRIEDRFPLAELDVVKKLNHHFYGAGDYALIAKSFLPPAPAGQSRS